MKIEQLVEKKLREKAPAASTEQPEKKVKQNWNSVDLSRALLKFRLSAAALKVALCVHSHQGFCKTGWNGHYVFHEKHMQEETGFVKDGEEKKIRQGLKDLVSVNAIEEPERIKVKGKWRGKVIKWNFDYSSWGRKNEPEEILPEEILPVENPPEEKLPEEKLPEENPPEEKLPEENPPVIRIIHNRKDYTDPEDYTGSPKDDTSLKDDTGREGAAAEPPPAPAAPSQGDTQQETAQGQTTLWGEPERTPEKPKGKQESIPPTLEEVITKLVSVFAPDTHIKRAKEQRLLWDDSDYSRYAEKFCRYYSAPKINWTVAKGKKRQKMKSWELTLINTWLESDDFMPPWKKNQLQGQQLAGQTMNEADVMAILTRRNTSQETFDAESNRISQYLENFQK